MLAAPSARTAARYRRLYACTTRQQPAVAAAAPSTLQALKPRLAEQEQGSLAPRADCARYMHSVPGYHKVARLKVGTHRSANAEPRLPSPAPGTRLARFGLLARFRREAEDRLRTTVRAVLRAVLRVRRGVPAAGHVRLSGCGSTSCTSCFERHLDGQIDWDRSLLSSRTKYDWREERLRRLL